MRQNDDSVDRLVKKIRDNYNWWDKFILHPKMNWLRWLIYNLPDVPRDIYLETKWFIQRGRRGYSDRDIWGIDYWLAEMMPRALRQLKRTKHGLPCDMFLPSDPVNKYGNYTKLAFKKAEKRWNKKLDNMIHTFETADKILQTNWHYTISKDYNTKDNKALRKRLKKINTIKIMTKRECQRYEQGWKDFQEHFFSLWD